jgi:hypothetical protein
MPSSLVEAAQALDANTPDACDTQSRDARREVAKAFDDANGELTALSSTLVTAHYKRVAMGPISVREIIAPFANNGVHVHDEKTWQELDDALHALPSTKDESWIDLDAHARSVMLDDWRRVMYESLEASEVDPSTPPGTYFRVNGAVSVGSDGAFHVPLDAGPFADAQDQLAGYIESVWSSKDARVKVDWVSSASNSDAFTFVLGSGEGGRSSVSWSSHTVTLDPDVTEKAIAHEIGHVLGFLDRYYTTFDATACRYSIKFDDDDIMSSPSTGAVTDAEWQVLQTKYQSH